MIFNLFILMGISWTTEVVSFILDGSFYSWFFTDCINSLMGFIIFIIFVCKARIGRLLIQNCSCLKKLFSSVEFVSGRTLPRRRSTASRSAAISMFQKFRSSSESTNSHSVVLIMSSFKISRSNTKKKLNQAASSVSGATASSSTQHHVICISPDSAQSNQIIETSSL